MPRSHFTTVLCQINCFVVQSSLAAHIWCLWPFSAPRGIVENFLDSSWHRSNRLTPLKKISLAYRCRSPPIVRFFAGLKWSYYSYHLFFAEPTSFVYPMRKLVTALKKKSWRGRNWSPQICTLRVIVYKYKLHRSHKLDYIADRRRVSQQALQASTRRLSQYSVQCLVSIGL